MAKNIAKKASGVALGSAMLLLSMMPAASAFAASAPAVISVSLSSEQGTVAVGNTVSFTATATQSGSGTPLYQFWYEGPNGNWHGTNWSTNNTFSLPPLQQGSYEVVVYAMDKGQSVPVNSEGTNTNQFVNVDSSATLTAPSLTNVAPGTTLTFTASSKNLTDPVYQLWIQLPDGSWIASGDYQSSPTFTYTAPVAGDYHAVLYAKDLNAPQDAQFSEFSKATFDAFGQAAAVKLSASSSSLVADGQATDTITATVVDANGNVVSNYNGPVNVSVAGGDINLMSNGVSQGSSYTYTATNGVVSIPLQSANTTGGGRTDQVTVSLPNTTISATQNISMVAQQATYVTFVHATPNIADNSATTLTLAVLDQDHNPMASGAWTAQVTVSGPATIGGGTSEYVGVAPTGTVTVNPIGQTGSITLTPSVSGLTGIPITLNLVAPGTATQLAVTTAPASSYSADTAKGWSATSVATVQVEDVNGIAVASPATPTATVTFNGQSSGVFTPNLVAGATTGSYNVELTYNAGQTITAGTYTVTVTDGTLPTLTIPVVITAGAAKSLVVTPAAGTNYDVLASNPNTTVTAQVVDQFGNPVADQGLAVDFTANSSDISLSGGSGSAASQTVDTNAQGVATVNADVLTSGADVVANATINGSGVSPASAALDIVNSYATAVKAQVSAYPTGASAFTAGTSTATVTFSALDSAGNPVSNDSISYTITGPNGYSMTNTVLSGTSAATVTLNALDAAGTYTVTAKDVSVPSAPSTTTTFNVVAASLHGFALFDTSGNDLSVSTTANDTVAANSKEAFTLAPVDAYGNQVTADATYTVALPTAVSGVTWENASGTPITSVTFTLGQGAQTVYLLNGTSSPVTIGTNGTPNLTAPTSGTEAAAAFGAPSNTTSSIGSPASWNSTNSDFTDTETGSATYTITVNGTAGGALANQTVYLTISANTGGAGTLSATQVITNANGQATFTWAPPSGWTSGDSNTITVTIGSGSAAHSTTLVISQ